MVEKMMDDIKEFAVKTQVFLPNPNHFPLKDHTMMTLFNQTYITTLIGLPTASLIMQGFLMEVTMRYLYFHHTRKDTDKKLVGLIKECYDKKYFSKDEKLNEELYTFCDKFRETVRNVQIHFDVKKQTKGTGIRGMKIKLPTNVDGSLKGEELLKLMGNSIKNFNRESEIIMSEAETPVANVVKFILDEKSYLMQFNELFKAILVLNRENNLDYKQ